MKISQTFNYEIIAGLNKNVHDLHVKLYPQYFKEYNYDSIKNFFRSIINNRNFIFLLLEAENEALGYAWIEEISYSETPFNKAYQSIYVHHISIGETKQNKGFGTGLMEKIYEIAKNKGIDLIQLDYWSENHTAKDFYKKHKFTRYREFVYKNV